MKNVIINWETVTATKSFYEAAELIAKDNNLSHNIAEAVLEKSLGDVGLAPPVTIH